MSNRSKSSGLGKLTKRKFGSKVYSSGIRSTKTCSREPDSLWDLLSTGLIEDILARLPVPQILQCRSVCKRWKVVIDSTEFSQFHDSSSCSDICFLVSWKRGRKHHSIYRAYFPLMDKWISLPPDYVHPRKSTGALAYAGPRTRSKFKESAPPTCGGLWCIQGVNVSSLLSIDKSTAAIHNPTSGWLNRLPAFPDPNLSSNRSCNAMSVMVNQTNGSFVVLCAGIHQHYCECKFQEGSNTTCLSCQLFDSRKQSWTPVADLPYTSIKFRYDCQNQISGARYGNLLYYAVQKGRDTVLLSFNLMARVWNEIPGAMPRQQRRFCNDAVLLFTREQSLILVMRKYSSISVLNCWFPRIYCWDLGVSPVVQNWVEVETPDPPIDSPYQVSAPSQDTLIPFYSAAFLPLSWRGLGDFILFSSCSLWGIGGLLYTFPSNSWKVITYDSNDSPQETIPREFSLQLTTPDHYLARTISLVTMALEVPLSAVFNRSA